MRFGWSNKACRRRDPEVCAFLGASIRHHLATAREGLGWMGWMGRYGTLIPLWESGHLKKQLKA